MLPDCREPLFLASGQARYLTGQVIVADGGLAINPQ